MIRAIVEHQAKTPEDAEKVIAIIRKIRDDIMRLPGYINGETLINTEDKCNIIVISTWESLEKWNEWWESREARQKLDEEAPFLAKPLSYCAYEYHHIMWMNNGT